MNIRERLLPILIDRFGDKGLCLGTGPAAAWIPPCHPEVGEVTVWMNPAGVRLAVGEIASEDFDLFLCAAVAPDAVERTVKNVVRFLDELLADRILLWRSTDGRRSAWRERGAVGHSDPLVLDDRTYRTYLWSRPLPLWQASPNVFARGYIQDEREYQIMWVRLQAEGAEAFPDPYRKIASELVASYERDRVV